MNVDMDRYEHTNYHYINFKMETLVLLCLLFVGALGEHYNITLQDCYGQKCYKHIYPYCLIESSTTGTCHAMNFCHRMCGSPVGGHGDNGCCCYNQECVNVFRNNKSNVYIPGADIVNLAHLVCYESHDLAHSEMIFVPCQHKHDVCMFTEHTHGRVEARCISREDCEHIKSEGHHHIYHTDCCLNNNCTYHQGQNYIKRTTATIKSTTTSKPTTTVATYPIYCYKCPDITQCNRELHRCNQNEVCMFHRKENVVEASCKLKSECEQIIHHHGAGENTACCTTDTCRRALMNLLNKTPVTSESLTCKHCRDLLQDDCGHDRHCYSDEACMIRHVDQRVETKCVEKDMCEVRHLHDLKHPDRFTICCGDVNCSQNAYNQSKHVNVQNGTTDDVCRDSNNTPFSCADYIRDFDICKNKAGTALSLATTKCKSTCGLCPGNTTQPAELTTVPYVLSTEPLNTTDLFLNNSNTTTVPASNPPCIDHDEKNICDAYGFYFCPATNGPAREFAVINCAKTCNLCYEYFASLKYGYIETQVENSTQSTGTNEI